MAREKITFDNLRRPCLTEDQAAALILQGKQIPGESVLLDDLARAKLAEEELNFAVDSLQYRQKDENNFHENSANSWFMPQEYATIDVLKFCLDKCINDEQIARVQLEMKMFEQREMTSLLRFLIFLVDYMRQNNYVWGLGRGSSVSSYVLYLIGIHKVDSIKYDLDITEFLK